MYISPAEVQPSWIVTGGFVELDIRTAKVLSQWDSRDNIIKHNHDLFVVT